ncbi:hypothetical protein [Streptomyces halstedii]|uniref:Uncharacterized protein n=1 Tax=Streptomyces halstedii TaxID=1944 RepID=A0A6N9U5A8_STRHA|nr:hypothetical protein [Streptomyces halstedii]NEA19031.1 hypothetical protein [Streptomyces halstedii]
MDHAFDVPPADRDLLQRVVAGRGLGCWVLIGEKPDLTSGRDLYALDEGA